jgi:hypothetical protein
MLKGFKSKVYTFGSVAIVSSLAATSVPAQALDPIVTGAILQSLQTPAKNAAGAAFNWTLAKLAGQEACNQPQTLAVSTPTDGWKVVPNGQRLVFNATNLRTETYGVWPFRKTAKTVNWMCAGASEKSRCPTDTKTVWVERHSGTRYFPVNCSRESFSP